MDKLSKYQNDRSLLKWAGPALPEEMETASGGVDDIGSDQMMHAYDEIPNF